MATRRAPTQHPKSSAEHQLHSEGGEDQLGLAAEAAAFVSKDASFDDLIGPHATLRLLARTKDGIPLFHEAGIYFPSQNSIYLSSNRLPSPSKGQRVHILRIPLDALPPVPDFGSIRKPSMIGIATREESDALLDKIEICRGSDLPTGLAMPNGAARWSTKEDGEGVLWCEQGRHNLKSKEGDQDDVHSALVLMSVGKPIESATTKILIDSYNGKRFSSINDAVVHEASRAVFFTDPNYGPLQAFKRSHEEYAPNGLYIWKPEDGSVVLLDDRYDLPNGVTFIQDPRNPQDGSGLLIVTDTGRFRSTPHPDHPMGLGVIEDHRPACIYTYPVSYKPDDHPDRGGQLEIDVAARKLLWHSESGPPDGVHPDVRGNLWVGHGDGLHIYNPWTRQLIGKVRLPKGVANFCWAGEVGRSLYGTMHRLLLFAEDELWECCVAVDGQD